MNAISERLKVYFDQCKLNSSDVASILGYKSSEKIGRLFRENDKNASPSAEILKDIASKFEDLSIHWVLTGVGEMYKTKTPSKPGDDEGVEERTVEVSSSALMAAQLRSNEIAMHTMIRAMRLVLSHVQGVSERKAKEQLDKILIEVSVEYPNIDTFHGDT